MIGSEIELTQSSVFHLVPLSSILLHVCHSLRFVFNDNDSNYVQLLNRVGQPSLFNWHVHYILTLVYKSLNGLALEYITNMFSLKTHSINLRASGTNSLLIPRVNTTTYGMHSLSYYGSKLWNSLPNTRPGLCQLLQLLNPLFVI